MMKSKKGLSALVILLILVGVIGVIGGGVIATKIGGFMDKIGLGSLLSYDIVYKQNYGHYCCVQEFDYDIIYGRFITQQNYLNCDDYTNECKIILENTDNNMWVGNHGYWRVCDIGYTNCGSWVSYSLRDGETRDLTTIPTGKSIVFRTDGIGIYGESTTKATKKAKSFYIKGMENGKVYRQESCVLDHELRTLTPASDGLYELTKTGANSCQNYLIDFVQVATKTYSYQGKEVICQTRQLYDIEEVPMLDGKTRKIQANKLKSVECCPSEPNCDEDTFKFVIDNVRDCTYDSECANAGDPVAFTSNSYVTFNCQNGFCQQSTPVTVECTNNAKCIQLHGSGSVCDLSTLNFGRCIKSTTPNFCGNAVCDELEGETIDNCAADCTCPDGQTLKVTDNGAKCTMPLNLKWLWIGLTVLAFVLGYKYARPYLQQIPFIGRIFP